MGETRLRDSDLDALRSSLADVPPGKLSDERTAVVRPMMADVWDGLSGAGDAAMAGHKITAIDQHTGEPRARNWLWEPPVLSFSIVRHGAFMLRSKRGERHRWRVDLDTGLASYFTEGYEKLVPNAPRVNLLAVMDRIAAAAA